MCGIGDRRRSRAVFEHPVLVRFLRADRDFIRGDSGWRAGGGAGGGGCCHQGHDLRYAEGKPWRYTLEVDAGGAGGEGRRSVRDAN